MHQPIHISPVFCNQPTSRKIGRYEVKSPLSWGVELVSLRPGRPRANLSELCVARRPVAPGTGSPSVCVRARSVGRSFGWCWLMSRNIPLTYQKRVRGDEVVVWVNAGWVEECGLSARIPSRRYYPPTRTTPICRLGATTTSMVVQPQISSLPRMTFWYRFLVPSPPWFVRHRVRVCSLE
jgi:hypothetical protein